MLPHYSNQKGYTLLVTLATILVIFIFTTVLFSTNINNALQLNRTEDNVQTTHLAEMGLEFFQNVLTYSLNNTDLANEDTINDAKSSLESAMVNDLQGIGITNVETPSPDNNQYYQFKVGIPDNEDTYYKVSYKFSVETDEIIRLTYKLTSGNKNIIETQPYQVEQKDLTWIKGSGIGTPGNPPSQPIATDPSDPICEDADPPCNVYDYNGDKDGVNITLEGDNKSDATTTVGNLYTEGDLTLEGQGTNSPSLVTFGDLYVKGTITLDNHTVINVQDGSAYFNTIDAKPNSQTTVLGNAYFYGEVNGLTGGGNSAGGMCIEGTAYLADSTNLTENDIILIPEDTNCDVYDGLSGIRAYNVSTVDGSFPDPPSWTSPESGTGDSVNLDPSYN